MRVRVLFLWCISIIQIKGEYLNLAALRSAGNTRPISKSSIHPLYNRFNDPLPVNLIAPNCGNGKLDQHMMNEIPQPQDLWNAGVIFVNEACDDGNRLDGDGCAADCASMDALTSPCPLAIDTGGEEIVTMAFYAHIFVFFTPTRMVRMGSVDLKILSIQNFTIGPVVTAWQESPFDFFVYGGGRIWMPLNSQTPIQGTLPDPSNSNYQPLHVKDSSLGIVLVYKIKINTYLVTAAGEIVNVVARRVTNWTNSSQDAAELWNVNIIEKPEDSYNHLRYISFVCTFYDDSQLIFVLDTENHIVLPENVIKKSPPSNIDSLNPNSPGYPWIYLFSMALKKHSRPMTTDITEHASYISKNTTKNGVTLFMVSPFSISYSKFSPRDIITGMTQLSALGDPLFTNGRIETSLCNGTNASCILDVPLCYDVLSPNAYSITNNASSKISTIFTALDNASRTSKTLKETVAKANLKCNERNESVQQILIHPYTQALWILRGSKIYEVNRRGTQVKAPFSISSEQCVPSMSGACMPGYWSWSKMPCKPCDSFSMMSDDGAYNNLFAYTQQCTNVDTSLLFNNIPESGKTINSSTTSVGDSMLFNGIRRRRLLQHNQEKNTEGIEMIVVTNVLTNVSSVTALFVSWGDTFCEKTITGGAWKYAYACKLNRYVKADPFQVLRALKATAKPNITDFLSPATRIMPYANPHTSQELPLGLMVGIFVGGGCLLILLCFFCFYCNNKFSIHTATNPLHNHVHYAQASAYYHNNGSTYQPVFTNNKRKNQTKSRMQFY